VIDLKLHLITDKPTREALKTLLNFVNDQSILKGNWKYIEFTFDKPVESFRYNHNLGFVPKDFIMSYLSGTGSIFINWYNSDRQFLDLTATGPCVVRGFIGAYA
jgi:hypothetical protein